ncbi:hypothetical protein PUN28_017983 [Cardiocondyla obscurior]|uniref:MADF domain-containing protein n=1 Tax=Cardiocondyla obscurior TaxID=286306 RepID=A0AAW2EJG9_9HYME
MSDYSNYCGINSPEINDCDPNDDDEFENMITIKEKNGDDFLIELYRERLFLYDKRNKVSAMKQTAWVKISKIMTETNCEHNRTKKQKKIIVSLDNFHSWRY